jgi:hypothetical protein
LGPDPGARSSPLSVSVGVGSFWKRTCRSGFRPNPTQPNPARLILCELDGPVWHAVARVAAKTVCLTMQMHSILVVGLVVALIKSGCWLGGFRCRWFCDRRPPLASFHPSLTNTQATSSPRPPSPAPAHLWSRSVPVVQVPVVRRRRPECSMHVPIAKKKGLTFRRRCRLPELRCRTSRLLDIELLNT